MSTRYRVWRLATPTSSVPIVGNAKGAAHVGDYGTQAAATTAGRAYASAALKTYIEPITWNDDLIAPVISNAGTITVVT